MRKRGIYWMMGALLCALLLLAPVASADEAPTGGAPAAEATGAPVVPGLSAFIFFIGAGAVLVVGGVMLARENFKEETA